MAKRLLGTSIFDDSSDIAIDTEDIIENTEDSSKACKVAIQTFTRLRVDDF